MDDIKLAGQEQHIDPRWKIFSEEVDLGAPTSFFNHVDLGCTERQSETIQDTVDKWWTMWESGISARATEKLPSLENPNVSMWSYDMEGHAKQCSDAVVNQRTKQHNRSVISPLFALTTSNSKKNLKLWDNCQTMLSTCPKMSIFGTHWDAWYSLVSQQACTCDHKMDQSVR